MPVDPAATQWPVLDPALAPHLGDARYQLHHAVQFASALGISFLEPSPDDSHSALEWHAALGALVSRPVPGEVRSAIRVGVRVATLELIVLQNDDVQSTLALHGVRLSDATEALRAAIAALGLTASRYTLRRHFSIPPHPVTEGAAFKATDRAAFAALAAAFGGAARSLEQLCAVTPKAGAVLCWPHHFDLATLVQLAPGRSSGAGLVAGDQYYDEPYYYVNANPSPAKEALPDALAGGGHWHSHEWIGAVLPASRLASDAAAQEAQISSFLQSALAVTQRLLAP